ncbi:hypothetical protein [Pseudomonas lopnurensis]|uniref:hypothetical protein n=1 Tax=Pseudomonas lopnurensis TaxID=1477517 RepID=UPI0028B09057|nr:hypothetical protein [Pseudomonas lopnurensis]
MEAKNIYIWLLIMTFSQVLLCNALIMYIAYFKLDIIFSHLNNSPDAVLRKAMMRNDPISRWLTVSLVLPMLTFPKHYLKKGGLDRGDLNSFPKDLRRLTMITYGYGLLLAVPFFSLCIYGQYTGWLK